MTRRKRVLLIILGFCLSSRFGAAAEAPKGEVPIHVEADSLSVREGGDVIEAEGNVQIRRQDTTLKADQARVNRRTQDAEAKGRVVVDDPQGRLRAESVRLNLEKETGELEKAEIFIERNHVTLGGERLEKFAGQVYRIDEGYFTTCICETGAPSWKIGAERIDLRREGEAVVRGGTFYILDVPVFYLPYGQFPVRSERQTGFLFPQIGFSSRDGFRLLQPFFWAISRSSDLTLNPVIETRSRAGLVTEYRHIWSQHASGQATLSYFNERWRKNEDKDIVDRTIADQTIPKDRWSAIATHRQQVFPGFLTYSDVAVFSDDLFTRELFHNFDLPRHEETLLRTGRYSRSRLGFMRSWADADLIGEAAYYQDFIQEDDRTFHRAPYLLFRGGKWAGGMPLEFRWRAEAVNYVRREGADGLRLDLRPELLLPVRFAPYLFGAFSAAPRETLYRLHRTEGTFDRSEARELIELRGRVGTALWRVFNVKFFELGQLKHVLEPEVSYLFIPRVRQREIPIMDALDRVRRRNLVTFGVANRFWGKSLPAAPAGPAGADVEVLNPAVADVREMAQLLLAISYDIDRERNGGDTLSDLDLKLDLWPRPWLAVGLHTGLDPGPWHMSHALASFGVHDPRPITRRVLDRDFMRPSHFSVGYRFLRRNFLSPLAENANLAVLPDERLVTRNTIGSLGIDTHVHVTDHLLFQFRTNYDARDARFLSHTTIFKLLSRCECWTFTLSLSRNVNPGRTRFNFEFNLLGLSSSRELFR